MAREGTRQGSFQLEEVRAKHFGERLRAKQFATAVRSRIRCRWGCRGALRLLGLSRGGSARAEPSHCLRSKGAGQTRHFAWAK